MEDPIVRSEALVSDEVRKQVQETYTYLEFKDRLANDLRINRRKARALHPRVVTDSVAKVIIAVIAVVAVFFLFKHVH